MSLSRIADREDDRINYCAVVVVLVLFLNFNCRRDTNVPLGLRIF
jgi:hypothetical protein